MWAGRMLRSGPPDPHMPTGRAFWVARGRPSALTALVEGPWALDPRASTGTRDTLEAGATSTVLDGTSRPPAAAAAQE